MKKEHIILSGGDQINLKQIRKSQSLSPIELAKKIGISRSSYYNKIKGNTDWTLKELVTLTEMCGEAVEVRSGDENYSVDIKKL